MDSENVTEEQTLLGAVMKTTGGRLGILVSGME
jgi:hypothetical protein